MTEVKKKKGRKKERRREKKKENCTWRKFILLQFSLLHLCLQPFIGFSQPPWQKQLQNPSEYECAFKLPAASFTPDEHTGARMQTGLMIKVDPKD